MKVTLACTTKFMAAKERLPASVQKKVRKFFEGYQANPRASGYNFEKIEQAASKGLRSIRIDKKYRAIVQQEKEGNLLFCLWVDNHDDAYAWARNNKMALHADRQSIQIFSTRFTETTDTSIPKKASDREGLFAVWQDRKLRRLGVPEEQIPLVRSIRTKADLDDCVELLPEDAFLALCELAEGASYEELARQVAAEAHGHSGSTFDVALQHPSSQRLFVIIKDDQSLERMMDAPLGEWRVYLHPTQRRLVEMNARGPIRVLGGAGTGKTVVALHRAKRLATDVFNGTADRLLFVVFSTNLVADVKAYLKQLCSPEALARIEITNIDAWVLSELRRQKLRWHLAYDNKEISTYWQEAIDSQDFELNWSKRFIMDEFSAVVLANGIEHEREYLRISRRGRGQALQRGGRRKLWRVFDTYRSILESANLWEREDAMRELRKRLANTPYRYRSIIVDEAQDLTAEAMRLLRALVPCDHGNDMMIVGDAHQRIYGRPLVLGRCGINIRGRGRRLRINYRTPEEVRACAVGVLAGVPYDDLDGSHDTVKGYTSLIRGEKPRIRNYESWSAEVDGILEHISRLQCEDALHRICLVARTNALVNRYIGALSDRSIPTFEISSHRTDDLSKPGIRISTMHRVKGLEFDHMVLASAHDGVLPLRGLLKSASNHTMRKEVERKARSLLYVACTRARKTLFISSYGTPSPLIADLLKGGTTAN